MNSGFKGYHPLINVLFFISVIVFGMFFKHPVCLFISFVSSVIYYLKLTGKAGRKTVFRFLLPMLFLVVIINSFFNHYGVTPLFTLPSGNRFTFEALTLGIASALATVSVIQWFFCCNEVVTEDKFMHVFGKLLPKGALVVSMILRFVPLYQKRYKEISQARKCLIEENDPQTLIKKIESACKNFGILVSWSFENAIETADSMKARGYGLKGRTSYSRFRWNSADTASLILLISADLIIIFAAFSGVFYSVYNPYTVINPPAESGTVYLVDNFNITLNPLSALGAASIAAYALLCFLPLITDLKEDIKWRKLKSKI